ncbi:MAG: WbqC family protein [Phycisphaerae bacterium]
MRIAILQPGYLPWFGFFEQMIRVDHFVYLDDVQYTKQDWRNRNRIKTPDGTAWLTVPVRKVPVDTPINRVRIDQSQRWVNKHIRLIHHGYRKAPFCDHLMDELTSVLQRRHELLQDLCVDLIGLINRKLNIVTPTSFASTLGIQETNKTQRLVAICQSMGADALYDGKAAADFIESKQFEDANIDLIFQDYAHPVYPQLWGDFSSYLSTIDLIFNCGPDARKVLENRQSELPHGSSREPICTM